MVPIAHNIYNPQSNLDNGSSPRTFSNFPTIIVLRGLLTFYPFAYRSSLQGNLLLMELITLRSLSMASPSAEPSGAEALTLSLR